MIEHLISALILVVAVIHVVPILGFFGGDRLTTLYGVPVNDSTLQILMRHRAALFGILAAFFAYAAFVPALQPIAFVGALASMGSFFYLAYEVGEITPAVRKIVVGDIVATVCLVAATGLRAAVGASPLS
ncbi:MAG: phosphopantetheine adenylyltransferase [Myxococcota bacterium]